MSKIERKILNRVAFALNECSSIHHCFLAFLSTLSNLTAMTDHLFGEKFPFYIE